jgi:hypothetical protein
LHPPVDFLNRSVLDAGLTRNSHRSATLAFETRVILSMTMRRDHRAIGGTAKRPAPHAALILAGLLLLIRP